MKVAAVLVVVAVLSIPSFIMLAQNIMHTAQGRDTATVTLSARPIERRRFYLFASAYGLAFAAAISWASYVFTNQVVFSILTGMGAPLVTLVAIVALRTWGRRWMPTPSPPQDLGDGKAVLEWENRRADIISKNFSKIIVMSAVVTLTVTVILLAFMFLALAFQSR